MDENTVYTFAKWQVKKDKLDVVLNLLSKVVKKSREEEGNLSYKVHQSNSEANTLILYEAYRDEAALATHHNSAHFQEFIVSRIIPLLENREVILTSQLNLD